MVAVSPATMHMQGPAVFDSLMAAWLLAGGDGGSCRFLAGLAVPSPVQQHHRNVLSL